MNLFFTYVKVVSMVYVYLYLLLLVIVLFFGYRAGGLKNHEHPSENEFCPVQFRHDYTNSDVNISW